MLLLQHGAMRLLRSPSLTTPSPSPMRRGRTPIIPIIRCGALRPPLLPLPAQSDGQPHHVHLVLRGKQRRQRHLLLPLRRVLLRVVLLLLLLLLPQAGKQPSPEAR